jgi:hypothetical protein
MRNPDDNSVRRTGTITKIKCTRPDPVKNWNKCKDKSPYEPISGRPNWYRYEIGTLLQPEPGVWTRSYEFCDEGLIRILRENETLDHDDTLHGLQRQESNPIESLNRSINKNEMKPVAKPITSKRKCRNPKIDKDFNKNNFDWSGQSSKKNESSSSDVFGGTRQNKDGDWSTMDFDNSETLKIARNRPIPPVPMNVCD